MSLININDIYNKITNNKVYVEIDKSQFDQGEDIMISPELKRESNYVFDLLNTFKKPNINKEISRKSDNDINELIKNSFLYHLSININSEISEIKDNIQKHINNNDYICLKEHFNSYKKGIQKINSFLMADDTDQELNDYVLYYLSYIYNKNIVLNNKNIYKIFEYNKSNNILLFKKNDNKYNFIESLKNSNDFEFYCIKNNLQLYHSNTDLNKLKINEVKELCNKLKISTLNTTKNLLITKLNEEFSKY